MRKSISAIKSSSVYLVLIAIILTFVSIQLVWLTFDKSVPTWDEAAHFSNALNYQKVLEHIQLFSGAWWRELWAQSPSYTAPFIYLSTVPCLSVFSKTINSGISVNILFIIVIVFTTYTLSRTAFNTQISLWASGLCLMFPALLSVQIIYMLDYGIVAISCLTFLVLTLWKNANTRLKSWQWSVTFGITFGCLMLSKPTGFLFLLFPWIYLISSFIKHRNWIGVCQFGVAIIISWSIFGSWFSQNWLTVVTSAISANGMGKFEGDPGGDTFAGWLYYFQILPDLISLPILVTTIGLVVLSLFHRFRTQDSIDRNDIYRYESNTNMHIFDRQSYWLLLYCFGGYFFCSLATNKDSRFILPILPVLAIFIAYIFNIFQATWARCLRWATVGITGVIILANLFWIPGTDNLLTVPYIRYGLLHRIHLKPDFPHQQIIETIDRDLPYLKSTIGVLSSSPELNAENLDTYGHLANFQVYARYLDINNNDKAKSIDRGLSTLNWYAIQTSSNNAIVNKVPFPTVEQNLQLQLHQSWQMPDASIVKLYRRKQLPISIDAITENIEKIRLERVIIAPSSELAVNTTYQLSGERNLLQNGLLILTWQAQDRMWHHDRAIGLGNLYLHHTNINSFRVTENSAMFPPQQFSLGEYQLTATYLDRRTGKIFPLSVPKIEIKSIVDSNFSPDSIAKLHQLSKPFARGKIDPVFSEINTLNQYDPTQDYLTQAQQAINYRIDRGESQLDLKYTLALTQAIQRQIEPLLANLTAISRQDPQNPYAWIYLGFVRLYHWQPQAAEAAFQMAEKLPSPPKELATLKLISALFRFDLIQAWQRYRLI